MNAPVPSSPSATTASDSGNGLALQVRDLPPADARPLGTDPGGQDLAARRDPSLSPRLEGHRESEMPPRLPIWRRLGASRWVMHSHRLLAAVLVANLAAGFWAASSGLLDVGLATAFVLGNFLLTVLVRQQRVVNLLFAAATAIPRTWPLSIRRTAGKVYHFGGLHIGGALGTTGWFLLAVILGESEGTATAASRAVSWLILVLLVAMLITASPPVRQRWHDRFELVHRFGGWCALILFGVHAVLMSVSAADGPIGPSLLTSPAVWVLLIALASVSSTWWDLRRVPVEYENPSGHVVIARFRHRTTFAGSSTALSRSPLAQWHHFANVHTPGEEGFRLTISRAGDWTGSLIDDQPETLWVKGIPTAGVGNIDQLFSRVLWVATGSGIGPTLPHLLAGDTPATLVWSTRSPRTTYGDALVDEIYEAQPDAIVWDTTQHGKPDLVKLAFAAFEERGAEAVICISNKPTTWNIVEAFEMRGIPAYGAIWDS